MNERLRFAREILPIIGYSRCKYSFPVAIPNPQFYPSSPAHKGKFKHAVDIAVPHPNESKTIVLSPISGTVEYVILGNTKWGTTIDYRKFMNYVHIKPDDESQEFVEIVHIGIYVDENGKAHPLKQGERVKAGQPIAVAALNGWITADENGEPDSHIHIMVGEWLNELHTDFKSLKIRWR